MVDHDQVQAALSARLDGEPIPLDDDVVDAHLAGCAQCRQFQEEAVALSRRLRFVEPAGGGMTPPDLAEMILAGVEPEWRRTANARMVGLALSRILLVIAGVLWVIWGMQLLGDAGGLTPVSNDGVVAPDSDPRTASLLVDAAAFRFSLALGLFTIAWKPRLVSGLVTVVAALWTFMFGFVVRDLVLDTVSGSQFLGLGLLLFTAVGMVWTWLNHHGYVTLGTIWRELGAKPV
ncbi:zf-HC2 domain-containing protein [Corynebacterium comes]|uniref:Putative zinc-finger domain-containing protein n=1 Tax=Corynebacterium comes TaxID=2675218 RepID=A0A6B8VFL2_9CORY|nr:zf-HC2 domain-containing protein [Corynebacterium comes]QGU04052.1 hypothetical protein CETAM_03895 [Corynebacterium comes]